MAVVGGHPVSGWPFSDEASLLYTNPRGTRANAQLGQYGSCTIYRNSGLVGGISKKSYC